MQARSATVTVTVNGEQRRVPAGSTLAALVDGLGVQGRFAVERNGEIVPRSRLPAVTVEPGDRIEVVQAIGGGAGAAV